MIEDPDTMQKNHWNDKGSEHDVGEPLKRKRDPDTMPENRQNDKGSGHNTGEPSKWKVVKQLKERGGYAPVWDIGKSNT